MGYGLLRTYGFFFVKFSVHRLGGPINLWHIGYEGVRLLVNI